MNNVIEISGTVTRPNDTDQYALGDVVGAAVGVAIDFGGVSKFNGKGAKIQSGVMTSSASQGTKLDAEVWLFSAAPAVDADNATFTPTDAEMATLVAIVPFAVANWKGVGSGAAGAAGCVAANLGILSKAARLYGVIVARNTYTPVADEVFTVKLLAESAN